MSQEEHQPDLIEGLPVKRLLESFGAGSFPEVPAEPPGSWQGRVLGGYELIEEIDRGGMGIVFRAEQRTLGRTVAVKILRSAGFAGEDELARFQTEAQILGQLNHPNIVPIYDVGDEDGLPFIAMKWIEGGTLLGQVDRCTEDPKLAATVMIQVGSAIHEAHRRGVLHRDLKPANILVDQAGDPHVTDFGLSRRLDDQSDLTRSRAIVGSPNYMAPEQISRGGESVTTAVDVFGLGAILYHLLTGRPPFEGDSALEVLKKVEEADPVRPSSLNPKVDRDLETICLKCLRRDPGQRYHSADALVEDLQRWEKGEPIAARPLTGGERLVRWSRRHPLRTLLVAASLVLLAAGIGMNAYYQIDLRASRDRALESQLEARTANEKLEANVVRLELERAEHELSAGRQRDGIQQLIAVLEHDPLNRVAGERLIHEWGRRRFPTEAQEAIGVGARGKLLEYSADGRRVAALAGTSVYVWDAAGGAAIMESDALLGKAIGFDLSSDGSILMMATESGTRAWDVDTGAILSEWSAPGKNLIDATLTPDGNRFLIGVGSKVKIFDLATQRELQTLQLDRRIQGRFCLSPSGELLVITHPGELAWWDLPSASLIGKSESFNPSKLAFSADSRRLIASRQGEYQIWDAVEQVPLHDPVKRRTLILGIDLDATGERCAIAFIAGKVEIYDADSGARRCEPIIAQGQIPSARFRPHSNLIGTISSGGMLRQWDLDTEIGFSTEDSDYVSTLAAFDQQHRLRVQRDRTYTGYLSNSVESREIPIDGSFWHATVSPSGEEIAVVTNHGRVARVRILDSASLEVLDTLVASRGLKFARYSPDGEHLIVTQDDGGMMVWDTHDRELRIEAAGFPATRKVAFSEDGKSVFASGDDGQVERWSLETGEQIAELCNHGDYADGIDVSPDGTMLITGGLDHRACWWKLAPGASGRATLLGEATFHGAVNWVHFSPAGGKYVMAASRDGTVRVWESNGMAQLCEISAHELPLNHASFSLDGEHVITVSMDASVRIWDAATGHPVSAPLRHDEWWDVPDVSMPIDRTTLEEISSHCEPGL